ncbi:MAG: T9SS type A sorting domain-containing protein [Ferruginibacter sp.]
MDASGIANLRVIQFHGTSTTHIPGTYSGTTLTINPADTTIVWNNTHHRWEITFNVIGFSGFIVTANGAILPLNLLSFTGQLVNSESLLQWKTADEINTAYFDIERSSDDIHFTLLKTIPAKGTGDNSYTGVDAQTQAGDNYYRLKSVDNDGGYTYSSTILISKAADQPISTLVIYPDPANNQLVVQYSDAGSNAILNIYSLTGQKELTTSMNGPSPKTLDISSLATGTYILEYNSGTKTIKKKFVKVY